MLSDSLKEYEKKLFFLINFDWNFEFFKENKNIMQKCINQIIAGYKIKIYNNKNNSKLNKCKKKNKIIWIQKSLVLILIKILSNKNNKILLILKIKNNNIEHNNIYWL